MRTRAIPERLRGVFHDEVLYKSTFTLLYLTPCHIIYSHVDCEDYSIAMNTTN